MFRCFWGLFSLLVIAQAINVHGNDPPYTWKLSVNGNQCSQGTISESFTYIRHARHSCPSADLQGLDINDPFSLECSGDQFSSFAICSTIGVSYTDGSLPHTAPALFQLFYRESDQTQITATTRYYRHAYILRGQITTARQRLACMLSYIFFFPCMIFLWGTAGDSLYAEWIERRNAQENAIPPDLPQHVSVYHLSQSTGRDVITSQPGEPITPANTSVIHFSGQDIVTQGWLRRIISLGNSPNRPLETIIIPGIIEYSTPLQVSTRDHFPRGRQQPPVIVINMTTVTAQPNESISIQMHITPYSWNDNYAVLAVYFELGSYELAIALENYAGFRLPDYSEPPPAYDASQEENRPPAPETLDDPPPAYSQLPDVRNIFPASNDGYSP